MQLEASKLAFTAQGKRLVADIDLHAQSGEIIGLVGPNGSGKSTILKTLCRLLAPEQGTITLAAQNIMAMSAKQLARHMAVVSQESSALFEFSVRDIVLMGRAPHKTLLEADSAADMARAQHALRQVGLAEQGQRSITTLSGGEKQRVMLARALVQDAQILVLDEPTNHLDIHYQLQLMELIRTLEVTVITALHDLNLAARYCDRLYVLQDGGMVAAGAPEEVLTRALLRRVFRVDADILRHPRTGKLHIVYVSGASTPDATGLPHAAPS